MAFNVIDAIYILAAWVSDFFKCLRNLDPRDADIALFYSRHLIYAAKNRITFRCNQSLADAEDINAAVLMI